MRIFVDENVPSDVAAWVRDAGHDVRTAAAEGPGSPDDRWLDYAWSERRVILTADRDFGDLVFRQRRPCRGVVYVRLDALPVRERALRLAEVWPVVERAAGRFATVTPERVRVRDIPLADEEE